MCLYVIFSQNKIGGANGADSLLRQQVNENNGSFLETKN